MSPEDILAELRVLINRQEKGGMIYGREKLQSREKEKKKADTENGIDETGLLKWLDFHPKSVDEIMEAVKKEDEGMTLSKLMFELIRLCMQGKAEQTCGNFFMKVKEESGRR